MSEMLANNTEVQKKYLEVLDQHGNDTQALMHKLSKVLFS